jgi:hypothetical protein
MPPAKPDSEYRLVALGRSVSRELTAIAAANKKAHSELELRIWANSTTVALDKRCSGNQHSIRQQISLRDQGRAHSPYPRLANRQAT